jgi:hypothetical protein
MMYCIKIKTNKLVMTPTFQITYLYYCVVGYRRTEYDEPQYSNQ